MDTELTRDQVDNLVGRGWIKLSSGIEVESFMSDYYMTTGGNIVKLTYSADSKELISVHNMSSWERDKEQPK